VSILDPWWTSTLNYSALLVNQLSIQQTQRALEAHLTLISQYNFLRAQDYLTASFNSLNTRHQDQMTQLQNQVAELHAQVAQLEGQLAHLQRRYTN